MAQPEYERVERPLIEQLVAMGWSHLSGADPGSPATDPARSGRARFTDTIYPDRFRAAVSRINPGPDGRPWLTPAQLDYLLDLLTDTGATVTGNLEVTHHLREGVNARTLPGWRDGDPEHVRLVDWDEEFRDGNDLLAVSQFRVERLHLSPSTPDLVLFVNGLPWVVIECKSHLRGRTALNKAIAEVIDYAGADAPFAVPDFIRFGQLLIATDRESAELGTVTAEPAHFAPWRTVEPATEERVRQETGTPDHRQLTPQAVLVAGVLRPAHLLHLVRDFTTQSGTGARAVKVVGRYPQFRAVKRLALRLAARRRAVAAGQDIDHRGGIVWHTQGSGKSLTMAFLVRHLRATAVLAEHKVVVLTDRLDLEKQIRRSLGASGEQVHRARTVEEARKYLSVDVPDLILVTVQKAQRDDEAADGTEETLGGRPGEETHVHNRIANPSSDIVVLIDEAHRSHGAWQHARWRAMLPRAAMVGFTGTPVIAGEASRKETGDIFGDFLDTYTLRDAERDRAVVPVRYEAHSVPLAVIEQAALDARFDEEVPEDPQHRERVLRRFARRQEILESPGVIAAKAEHMMRHWAMTGLPDHLGAQVVAVSRKAAVAYRSALLTARDRLVAEVDALDAAIRYDPVADESVLTDAERELLYLLPHRDLLAAIDVAVVISEVQGTRDPADWRKWTLKSYQDDHIARFTAGIGDFAQALPTDPSWPARTHGQTAAGGGTGPGTATGEPWHGHQRPTSGAPDGKVPAPKAPLAFLVVQSMLLTGFDAPVEQSLYLDRAMSGVNLLQAIARTNRPYPAKSWGRVVDYVGIGPELTTALSRYDQEHLHQVYGYRDTSTAHLQPGYEGPQPAQGNPWLQVDAAADRLLRELRAKVFTFLHDDRVRLQALDSEDQREDLIAVLADPLLRSEFNELVRDFLAALNAVLPRPQALAHESLAKQLGEVQYLARRRYPEDGDRDRFSARRHGAKVRQLIARHLEAGKIEERVPPIEITHPDFMARVNANPRARTRVSYMAGRLRLHIDARLRTDPPTYERFSARLEEITRGMAEDFEKAAASLESLVAEVQETASAEGGDTGPSLDPYTEGPVLRLIRDAVRRSGRDPLPPGIDLIHPTRELCGDLAVYVRQPSFDQLPSARVRARRELRQRLEDLLGLPWEDTGQLPEELIALAVARRAYFLRYGAGER